ncbi:MAG: hypothetical protein GC185_07525 [Alphaproteobacteria bacterium]|nr:hypothetical protein [Alphaproteobacteria bacterium]
MTHDDDNDIDIIDTQEDFDQEPAARASLKETWDSNPMLKIGAVVLGLGLLVGVYLTFFAGDEEQTTKSVVAKGGSSVKTTIGKTKNDPIYQKQIELANKRRAEEAAKHGGSSINTPTGTSQSDALALPPPAPTPQDDPLREWRQKAEMARMSAAQEHVPDQPPPPRIAAPVKPITPVQQIKMDPNVAKALAAQMRVIIHQQTPRGASMIKVTNENSAYVKQQQEERKQQQAQQQQQQANGGADTGASGGTGGTGGGGNEEAKAKLIVAPGSIAYAQLLTELNSDIPSPAMAMILSGPFEGGKALGSFAKHDEYLTLQFTRIVKDGVTYTVSGMALDENTTLPAEQSEVNHHYLRRIILPAAAAFLTSYTQALATTGTTTTTTSGGGVATDNPAPTSKQATNAGLSSASNTVSSIISQDANKPVTIIVHKGTTMGILFLDSVTTKSVSQ